MSHDLMVSAITFFAAAVIVVPLFRSLGLGSIIGYLFAGLLIGPQVFSLITDVKTILGFSELGVVFLLFLIGLELQPQRLWRMRREVFGLGCSQVIVTGLVMSFGLSFLFATEAAVILGMGLALSSTAFALQMLREKNQHKTLHGQSSFSILLFQDLSIVPLLALVSALSPHKSGLSFELLKVAEAIGMIVLLVLAGRYLLRPLLRWIAESRVQEVFTALSLLIVMGVAFIMEELGLSMALGAFLAGVLLANSEYRHELEINLEPFKGLLLGMFFMAVGMSLDLKLILERPHWLLLSCIALLTLKGGVLYSLCRIFKLPHETSRNVAVTIPQGGEFAFVLFAAAQGQGILSSESVSFANTMVTLTMALTPALFSINQKYFRRYTEISEKPFDSTPDNSGHVIIAGFGRFGQIIARILSYHGVTYTVLEHSAAQVDTARKYGTKIYYGDARRKDVVHAAGAKDAKIFFLAIDSVESSIEAAKMAIKEFPNLKIMARARNREHVLELMSLGIPEEYIFRETFESSLLAASDTVRQLGLNTESTRKIISEFRQKDRQILREQFKFKDSEHDMISFTNQANQHLEQILKAER